MRTTIACSALLCVLAVAGSPTVTAADVAASASAAAAKVPAVNQTVIERCVSLAQTLSASAKTAKDAAQQAAAIPFAGDAVKKALEKAKMKSTDADALVADLKGLANGTKPAAGSLLSKVAGGQESLKDRLKDLPGADTLQQILATPGVVDALSSQTAVDSLPGFASLKSLLGTTTAK